MAPGFNITTQSGNTLVEPEDGSPLLYSDGDMSWVLTSTALVTMMTFGVAYLFSGLLRRKNALSMLFIGLACFGVVTIQYFLIGYSLAFSDTGSSFIGDLKHFAFINVSWQPAPTTDRVPRIVFALYQLTFAAITPIIAVGACGERGRIGPVLAFTFLWSTLVYDSVAYWSWSKNGFFNVWGVLDFAGGGVVHMTSGTAALCYSLWLGKRRGYGSSEVAHRPNNISNVVLGTVFMTVGWFGFNGGSALAGNLRAAFASFATILAAMSAGVTWCLMDLRFEHKWSTVSFCTGVLTGLIAVTPASGFVRPWAALTIGIVSSIASNLGTSLKFIMRCDDSMDIFATHALGDLSSQSSAEAVLKRRPGGFVGNLMTVESAFRARHPVCEPHTGIFADRHVALLDGTVIAGGAINGNGVQIAKQLAYSSLIFAWTFVMSSIILLGLDHLPYLTLRVHEEAEREGVDLNQMNEFIVDEQPAKLAYSISDFQRDSEIASAAAAAAAIKRPPTLSITSLASPYSVAYSPYHTQ